MEGFAKVRICVIFNPAARGEKARRFRRHLDTIGSSCTLKLTSAAGDARRLAAEAVREGFDIIAAAGGDGTMNEVLNGIGDVPGGFDRCRLAVLPLGTVNVFARELRLPRRLGPAWRCIQAGHEALIDLPLAEFVGPRGPERRWFAQLAGAGLDARAVELVNWPLKKQVGPLAYIWAGLVAVASRGPTLQVSAGGTSLCGQLVVIGNGKLYGGNYRVFEGADLRDGILDAVVFPTVNWFTLARCGPQMLVRRTLPAAYIRRVQAPALTITSDERVPFQLDGELAGTLPAKITIQRQALRVVVP